MTDAELKELLRPHVARMTQAFRPPAPAPATFSESHEPADGTARPATFYAAAGFSADDAGAVGRYFAADDDGHYPGDVHRYFGLNVRDFADRSHLVRKQITNSLGHRTWVWVNPEKGKHAGRDDTPAAPKPDADAGGRHATLDAENAVSKALAAPHELAAEHVEQLARHLDTLPRDRLRDLAKQVQVKMGSRKAELVQRLLDHVKGRHDPTRAPGAALERGDTPAEREPGEKAEPPAEEVIGRGSTGDVRRVGDEVRKNARGHEAEVYKELAGVAGVATGRQEGGEIVTPHFPHVVSVDTVPEKERARLAPVVRKALPDIVNAVTALSEAGYDYNDPIQVGFDKSRGAHVFDFSAATPSDEATTANLSHLANYLDQFGLSREGGAVRQVGQVLNYVNNPDAREFDSDSPEAKDAERVAAQLDGKPAAYAYYSFNAREIPGVAQTEYRDRVKAVYSDKPLTPEMMRQWELHPAIHRSDNAAPPAPRPSPADRIDAELAPADREALRPDRTPAPGSAPEPAAREPTLQELETGVRPGGGPRAKHLDPLSSPYRVEPPKVVEKPSELSRGVPGEQEIEGQEAPDRGDLRRATGEDAGANGGVPVAQVAPQAAVTIRTG